MYTVPTFATDSKKERKSIIKPLIIFLITVILISIIIFTIMFVKIYKIHGSSMNPTLMEGDYTFCIKTSDIKRGDIIAFAGEKNFVIKRVIGLPGETIDISLNGDVLINNQIIDEPYITNKAKGDVELYLPYKIPANSYFVLGDNRGNSLDSRNHTIGTLYIDEIICEVVSVISKN